MAQTLLSGVLGNKAAREYRIAIHDRDGRLVAELDERSVTGLSWGRSLSQVSSSAITGNPNTRDAKSMLEVVRPWFHWISVFRGDSFVWTGPIMTIRPRRSQFEITAKDPMIFSSRTRNPESRSWAADPVKALQALWDQMMLFQSISRAPDSYVFPSGLSYQFDWVADMKMLNQTIDDVVKLGAEYTVVAGRLVAFPSLRIDELVQNATQFGDEDFTTELELMRDGSRLYTDVRLQGQNWAATAKKDVDGLKLQAITNADDKRGRADIEQAARQWISRAATPRAQLKVPSGAGFTAYAPVVVEMLAPGAVFKISTDIGGGVTDLLRLEEVAVTVDASGDRFAVTFGGSPQLADTLGVQGG